MTEEQIQRLAEEKYPVRNKGEWVSDAVGFAEWINKEGHEEYDGFDRWIAPHENYNVYSTVELYNIFKLSVK